MTPVLAFASQSGAQANGGVSSLVEIARALPREVVVVTDRAGSLVDRLRDAGREVLVWPLADVEPRASRVAQFGERAQRLPALGWFNARARDLVRERGARVVLANDIRAFWHAAPGARAAGAQVVFTVRDMFPVGATYGPKWRLVRHVASHVVALSDAMRDEVLERIPAYPPSAGAPVSRIFSVVRSIRERVPTAAERAEARATLGLPAEGPLFVYVATFCDKKNQLDFLRHAAPSLLAQLPSATLAFVGDFEPERDAYAQQCRHEGVRLGPRVRFAGYRADVRTWYRAATATVLASRYEGLARAMIESLAEGTPVVSFDVTSAREVLEGRGAGRVHARGDWSAFVGSCAELACEPALAERLAAQGLAAAGELFSEARARDAWAALVAHLECAR
jgi:glycosyltransferase involved in cell wall biosynthesis